MNSRTLAISLTDETYVFQNHVRACETDDGVVLLNLRKGTYSGFERSESNLISECIRPLRRARTMPVGRHSMDRETLGSALFTKLLGDGLIKRVHDASDIETFPSVAPPEQELLGVFRPDDVVPRSGDWIGMIAACAWATIAMRFCSLERVVRTIQARKSNDTASPRSSEIASARRLAWIFDWMRPFVYKREECCLFDSLALQRFMMARAINPTFVIGVRTRPFKAHAWLQLGAYVINGVPSEVGNFEPILVV